jgi:hypothetical protein
MSLSKVYMLSVSPLLVLNIPICLLEYRGMWIVHATYQSLKTPTMLAFWMPFGCILAFDVAYSANHENNFDNLPLFQAMTAFAIVLQPYLPRPKLRSIVSLIAALCNQRKSIYREKPLVNTLHH